MAYWGTFELDGAIHCLKHLNPFIINVQPKSLEAPNYKVEVKFSHHTFTRKRLPGDRDDEMFGPNHDRRCFCLTRLVLSHDLTKNIEEAAKKKAFFPFGKNSKNRNFLLIKPNPKGMPYLIAFNVEASKSKRVDAIMFVVSAHPRADLPAKHTLDSISFATLIAKTINGEQIKRPPKRK